MVSSPSLDVQLTALDDQGRPLEEWLTTFHMATVVVDPFTNESSWVLKPALRILDALRGASVRVNLVVTANAEDTRRFLGPITDEFMVFTDEDRAFVRSLALESLPAFLFLRIDGTVQACAQGWDPHEWHHVAEVIAEATAWRAPVAVAPGEPGPFAGSPALG